MNLDELFDRSLVGRADRIALEHVPVGGALQTLTFGQLDARANRLAHELEGRGLARGGRLCVHLPNRVEFIDLYLACTRLGAVFVPINILYRERELRHILVDATPAAVVVSETTDIAYPDGATAWTVESLAAGAAGRPASRPPVVLDADAPAMIVYTSGTTGVAKGAVLSRRSLAANGMNVAAAWRITDADRYLSVLPLFHVHGLGNGVHSWLATGCRMRLAERFDHRSITTLFAEFEPTVFFGVPTMYTRLLDPAVVPDDAARAIGRAARLFVSGSAPLPAHVHDAFRRRFGHVILERYGMSETLMIMTNPYEGERRAGTVGSPFPGVSVRLIDAAGADVAGGEIGEVCVRGPSVLREYWGRPDATDAAFIDGWFRTGDLAVRSPDGYYTLRGRIGDMIISGGFNIYPREIEELLMEDARVREAAVVGIPDTVRGEVPVAYVVGEPALDLTALAARCRDQLASFKLPREFIRVDALPRNAMGKVQKSLLPAPTPRDATPASP